MIIYIDLVILITFFIIFIINYTSLVVLKDTRINLHWILKNIFASLLVSIISTFNYINYKSSYISYLIATSLLIINIIIIFNPKSFNKLFEYIIIEILSSMLIALCIYTVLNQKVSCYNLIVLLISFVMSYIILYIINLYIRKAWSSNKIYSIEICIKGNIIKSQAILDTGNNLSYLTNPVSIIDKSLLTKEKHPIENIENINMLSTKTIHGISKIPIIKSTYIRILNYEGGEKIIRNAYIGISDIGIYSNNCNFILNPKILF